jgi:CheY-specific phosphatase CheX
MNNANPHISVHGAEDVDVLAFLNLEEMVERVVADIFEGMISLPVERDFAPGSFSGPLVASTIEFSGVVEGKVHLHTSVEFARTITAALTELPPEEIDSDLLTDTIGEVTNMVSGNLHTDISNTGCDCELHVPKITHAEYVAGAGDEHGRHLRFRHEDQALQVTLCFQPKENR